MDTERRRWPEILGDEDRFKRSVEENANAVGNRLVDEEDAKEGLLGA